MRRHLCMSSQSVDQQNLNVLQAMKEYAWASNAYHFVSSFGEFNEPCAPFLYLHQIMEK